jgi:hypothetical protein
MLKWKLTTAVIFVFYSPGAKRGSDIGATYSIGVSTKLISKSRKSPLGGPSRHTVSAEISLRIHRIG